VASPTNRNGVVLAAAVLLVGDPWTVAVARDGPVLSKSEALGFVAEPAHEIAAKARMAMMGTYLRPRCAMCGISEPPKIMLSNQLPSPVFPSPLMSVPLPDRSLLSIVVALILPSGDVANHGIG